MTASLVGVCFWIIAANVAAMVPAKNYHWNTAYVLIVLGVPLLGWVTYENGPIVGLLCLAGGVSILRWPVRYLARWLRSKTVKGQKTVE
ncbi:MAG: DUF2484 family protein [Litoreibacter sp.]